jgi:hypothetical protein
MVCILQSSTVTNKGWVFIMNLDHETLAAITLNQQEPAEPEHTPDPHNPDISPDPKPYPVSDPPVPDSEPVIDPSPEPFPTPPEPIPTFPPDVVFQTNTIR